MSRFQGGRPPGGGGRSGGGGPRDRDPGTREPPTFDPTKPPADLLDTLAEKQAQMMPSGRDELKSSQLRRFFGDVKELYRRCEQGSDYKREVEPMFKMIRSKASYAFGRQQAKIPREFHDFIDNGVKKVTNEEQFKLFVQHFEAVVGFLYGLGKVGRS